MCGRCISFLGKFEYMRGRFRYVQGGDAMREKIKKVSAIILIFAMIFSNIAVSPVSAEAAVKVTAIKLNSASKNMYVGEKITLKVKKVTPAKASKKVTWKSSNKKVATVSSKGKVTAKKAGTVKITATSKSNKKVKAVCTIKVIAKPSKIVLNYTKKTLDIGDSFTLKVKAVTPKKAEKKVTFTSSKKSIATVASNGKVTAKKSGTAVITVKSAVDKKIKATCKITVNSKEPTEEPDPTEGADPTEEPEATKEPEATEEPEVTKEPEATEEPEVTKEPEVTETPKTTNVPEVTEIARITETPTVTEIAGITETPIVTGELEITKTPEVTGTVGITVFPIVTGTVGITITPEATKKPEVTHIPSVTGIQVPTESPKTTGIAEITKAPEIPEITTIPETTEYPEITTTPKVTETVEVTPTKMIEPTKNPTPTQILWPTNTPTPSLTPAPTLPIVGELRNVGENDTYLDITGPRKDSVGTTIYDCVYFGNYPQSDITGETTEPIKWRVLSVNGTEAFLVADSSLDSMKYSTGDSSTIYWENSAVRSWLNGYDSSSNASGYDYSKHNFIDKAFTAEEQEAILLSTITKDEKGWRETEDKIYLLSSEEAIDPDYGFYWDINTTDTCRKRYCSEYAKSKFSAHDYVYASVCYFLLDKVVIEGGVSATDGFGGSSVDISDNCGICPVLHLDLSKVDVWKEAGEVRVEKTETTSDLAELTVIQPGETKEFSLEGEEIAAYTVYDYATSYTYGLGNASDIHPFSEAESFSVEKTDENTIALTIPENYTGNGLATQLRLNMTDWDEKTYQYDITIWMTKDNFAYNVCDGNAVILEYVGEDKESIGEVTIPDTIGDYPVTKVDSGFVDCVELTVIKALEGITEINLENPYSDKQKKFKKLYVPTTIQKVAGAVKEIEFADGMTELPAEICKETIALCRVTIPDTVTNIGDSAFVNQASLTITEFPKNVISCGEMAFYNCNVSMDTLPDSLQTVGKKAFYGCNITAKKLPDSIETIGEEAFSGCVLTVNELPEKLVTIGKNAFKGGTLAETITVPASVETCIGLNGTKKLILAEGRTEINSQLLKGVTSIEELILPRTLTKISGTRVFEDCTNVKELFLPNTIESVACAYTDGYGYDGAFSDCSINKIIFEDGWELIPSYMFYGYKNGKLQEVVLPDSVKTIGSYAFMSAGIQSLRLPVNLKTVGGNAFYLCNKLEKVTVPAGLHDLKTTIDGIFGGCNLKTVEIEDGITRIPEYMFDGAGIEELILPDTVTIIGSYAFAHTDITSLKLPQNITFLGAYAFYDCKNLEKVTIPATVQMETVGFAAFCNCPKMCVEFETGTTVIPEGLFEGGDIQAVIIPDTVKEIGARAFYGCKDIKTANLPEGLEKIGQYAFGECEALEEITIPSTLKEVGGDLGPSFEGSGLKKVSFAEGITGIASSMFTGADKLTELVFPETLKSIGDRAFYGCDTLTTINLPESLTSIGCLAFGDCTALTEITIPNSVSYMGDGITGSAFEGSGVAKVTFKEGRTVIPQFAFSNCKKLETVILPSTIEEIGMNAFSECSSIASIELPEGIKKLGDSSFANTTALKEITLPKTLIEYGSPITGGSFEGSGLEKVVLEEGTTKVCEGSFMSCENLTSVQLPSTITSIESRAFAYCEALTEFTIPSTVVSLGESVFMYSGISKISVPASVKSCGSMAWSAFDGENIKEVTLEEGFTEIYDQMFGGCSGLTKVNCPSTLIRIGSNAFTCCSSLESFVVPDGVTTIDKLAFGECYALTSVTIPESVIYIEDIFWRVTDTEAEYPTIITKEGSTADTFAQSKGYTVIYIE